MYAARSNRRSRLVWVAMMVLAGTLAASPRAEARANDESPAGKPSRAAVMARQLGNFVSRALHLDVLLSATRRHQQLHTTLGQGALEAVQLPSFKNRNKLYTGLVGFETGLSAFWADLKRRPFLFRAAVLGKRVQDAAVRGLRGRNFEARRLAYADGVANESAMMAMYGLNVPDVRVTKEIRFVFTSACRKAGALFKPAFAEDGRALSDKAAEYNAAVNGAGPVARNHLVSLLVTLDRSTRGGGSASPQRAAVRGHVEKLLQRVSLEDVAKVFAEDLGLRFSVTAEEMHTHIQRLVFDKQPVADGKREPHWAEPDYEAFRKKPEDGIGLQGSDLRALRWGIRLANATWKSGQIHRAVWEKEVKGKADYDRILPAKRVMAGNFDVGLAGLFNQQMPEEYRAYDAFDLSRSVLFRETFKAEYARLRGKLTHRIAVRQAQKAALSRVVYELFLDVKELSRGLPAA